MKKISSLRFHQLQECLSPLGKISCRPLFGGYSLAIDDTVFAMVAEGEIYLKICEQSAEYRVVHATPSFDDAEKWSPGITEILSG